MQGMEKDIILLATTVTHAGNFATDAQRVNVALTRAKHHLLVLGCSHVLRASSPAFKLLLASCQILSRGANLTSVAPSANVIDSSICLTTDGAICPASSDGQTDWHAANVRECSVTSGRDRLNTALSAARF